MRNNCTVSASLGGLASSVATTGIKKTSRKSLAFILLLCAFFLAGHGWAACAYSGSEFVKTQEYSLVDVNQEGMAVPHVLLPRDYNGDGLIDLAALSRSYVEATILFGNGDGTFQMPPARYPLRTGSAARNAFHEGMCDGDLDGDGDYDIAAVDWGRHELCILFNNGEGVFSEPEVYFIFNGANPHGVIAKDVDFDGDLDLVTTDDLGDRFSLYSNDGTGTFTNEWHVLSRGSRPQNVAVGDFDGDGDMDYVAPNSGWEHGGVESMVAFFRNDSDSGPLGPPTFEGYLANVAVNSCALAAIANDVDEDGKLDVVVSAWLQGVLSVFWGDGEGGFSPAERYATEGTAVQHDFADFNQDGFKDIAVCLFEAPKVQVFWGQGDRNFEYGPLLQVHPSTSAKPRFPALADFDRDGDIDIASVQYGMSTVVIFENQCSLGQTFMRGDPNADGDADLSDAVTILIYLFGPDNPITCFDSADVNDDGGVDLADAIALLAYMFSNGDTPPLPFEACGTDESEDDLDCESFEPCD